MSLPPDPREVAAESRAAPSSDDRLAADLRGFGAIGILAILVVLAANVFLAPLGAVLVLVWVLLSRTPWHEIGYVRPKNWIATVATGIVFGIAFKLVMKAVVMPLLGAPPINQAHHDLAGNPAALPGAIFMMIVIAGFGEETVFRGFLFERLGRLFGRRAWATPATVLLTSILFASLHYFEQGLPGVEQAMITGLAFGAIFAITGEIWMLMVAHATFDLTAVAIIYWDLETRVAHLFFR